MDERPPNPPIWYISFWSRGQMMIPSPRLFREKRLIVLPRSH